MVDPADAIGMAREAVAKRVELPGMSLMEHLDELRKRIVRSAIFLALGFVAAWAFHDRFVGYIQAPLNKIMVSRRIIRCNQTNAKRQPRYF